MLIEIDDKMASVVKDALSRGLAASESAFLTGLIESFAEQQKRQSEIDDILLRSLDGPFRSYDAADDLRTDLLARFDARNQSKSA